MNQELLKFYRPLFLGTAVLAGLIVTSYSGREVAANSAHVQWLAAQRIVWAQDDAARAISLARQTSERERVYADEERNALGGPLGEATKNPGLDIRQMLHDTAVACAPADTVVSVNVDRFTEFDVAMTLPQSLSVDRLAVMAKAVLQLTGAYVHSLRFIQGDNLLGYLGSAEIAAVTNWNTVPLKTVAWRLTEAGKLRQTGITPNATAAQDDAPLAEEAAAAQPGVQKAQADFKIDYTEHVRQLNSLMRSLNLASQLAGIQSSSQFALQMNSLAQNESDLNDLRTFFLNQSADLVLLLRDQGVAPLLVTIYQRGVDDDNTREAPVFEELFDAISTQLQQTRKFLTTMDTDRGEWSLDAGGRRVQFTSAEAHDAYANETSQIQTSARRVREAVETMSDFKPAHAPTVR